MENKFKKGLILGGLLAAAAAIGFSMTKDGKELNEELQKDLKTLVKHLKKNLSDLQDVSKESFNDMVNTVVEEYTKKKELATDTKEKLISVLQSKWKEMEEEYLSDKEDIKSKK
jgi:gas vesicle protein